MAVISRLMVRVGVDPDGVRRGVQRASRELGRLRDHASRMSRTLGRSGLQAGRALAQNFGRGVAALGGIMARGAMTVAQAAAPIAAIGSAALAALPVVLQLASGVASLGSAVITATPAFIGLGAGVGIAALALRGIFAEGSKARAALSPLGDMLSRAAEAGSAAAARGIRPLAEALRRVAQPVVTRFMEHVGAAANRVQREFLGWARSTQGVQTLRGILEPISASMERLAPHVSRVAIAFAQMLGRVMGVSMAMGTRGLAGALDWLAQKLDAVQADRVQAALSKLGSTAMTVINAIRTVAGWIGKLVAAYRTYTTQFGLVADGLAVVAMVFGGPVATAIGAASLIIRHFDQIKAAWERLRGAFQGGGGGGPMATALQNMRAAAATVLPQLRVMFGQIRDAVWPVLKEIGAIIKNDVIPTFSELMRALAPIQRWFMSVIGPVVASALANLLGILKGALNIIIGVVKVFIAIITGDWGKAWEGIKQILRGAVQIIVSIVKQAVSLIKGAWNLLVGIVRAVWTRAKNITVSLANSMMRGAVTAVRNGLNMVRSALGRARSVVTGAFRGAGSWLVSAGRAILDGLVRGISSAISRVRSILSQVTGMIPSWKGPMRVDLRLLRPTGAALMQGLVTGIERSIPMVRAALQGVTGDIPAMATPRGVTQAAAASAAPVIEIRSGGSRLDDALVELLRRAISDRGGNVQRVLGR